MWSCDTSRMKMNFIIKCLSILFFFITYLSNLFQYLSNQSYHNLSILSFSLLIFFFLSFTFFPSKYPFFKYKFILYWWGLGGKWKRLLGMVATSGKMLEHKLPVNYLSSIYAYCENHGKQLAYISQWYNKNFYTYEPHKAI